MKTWAHILFSLILAAAFYPLFGWKISLIFIGGVFIDIDHYFWYAYYYKDLNLFKAYKHFLIPMEKRDFTVNLGILLIFHTIEFLALVLVLSFYSEYALAFGIGLLFHYILDLIFLLFVAKKFIANHSILYWLYKNKIQKV